MGAALVAAALDRGHEVVVVSGPVEVDYPAGCKVIRVTSTEQMLAATEEQFHQCEGLIGAAAPCDYRPRRVAEDKISKTGEPLRLELVETEDVVAMLGQKKGTRWVVGFALETEDHRLRALAKLERKCCDLMVSNGVEAMNSLDNQVEVLAPDGVVLAAIQGTKQEVARGVMAIIQNQLVDDNRLRRRGQPG